MATAFERLPNDETRPAVIRVQQVALQAELLREGAYWEESLAILREAASRRRTFAGAADALAWYRSTHHPAV